ncbi:signal peptide-containing protein [Cryptosporidium canis]|nr:signal peptide-containing protein [Cryptosporidium canis]
MCKIRQLVFSILIIYLNVVISNCKGCGSKNDPFQQNIQNKADFKYFEVSVTSSAGLNTIRSIKEHISALDNYNDQSYGSIGGLNDSINTNVSSIEDDVLFMESFISSFSTQSNISAPFSTNGVTVSSIPVHEFSCNSDTIFDTSSDDMHTSIYHHLISKLIPDLDQINRTVSVIPWRVMDNAIQIMLPEIQKLSYELTIISTSISNNIELLRFYSNSSDIKAVQWEALQMASFARGYSRYILETASLASSLVLIAPKSKEPSIFSDIRFFSALEYPREILKRLREGHIKKKKNYECTEFFDNIDIYNSCTLCFSIFLTLYSRLQCQFIEVGVSRESILGVRWLEEIHSHLTQLNKLLLSMWNHFVVERHTNSSHYTPPKPTISWMAFKLKLYEEFRMGVNFQQRIKQNSQLYLNDNIFFNRYSKKDSDIDSYIGLKCMNFISNMQDLNSTEVYIIEEIIKVYNEIIDSMNYSRTEMMFGSITKLSNSLVSIAVVLGTYGDRSLINLTLQSLREKYDISNDSCRKLHRDVVISDNFDHSVLTNIYVKYIYCKNSLSLQINRQISIQYRFELAQKFLRKILISTRNSLFEKIRERATYKKNVNISFDNSFTKYLSQFQIILGFTKIIRSKSNEINYNLGELLKFTDDSILSLEKFKIKLVSFIFNNRYFFLEKGITEELNDISYPLTPMTISLGPYLFDILGKSLKMTVNKLRSKISLLNKLISFSRVILVKRRRTVNNRLNYLEKNKTLYSTALRIYNNRDELIVINNFTKSLYKTLKSLGRASFKTAVPKQLVDKNYHFDFGKDDRCNLKNNILALKETELIGCKLFNKMVEMIQIDELFSLLQKQFINIDNTERKIYYEVSVLFDEIWPDRHFNGDKVQFRNISSRLYTLKSLLENMMIFNGIARNSLVPYLQGMKNSACLYDFLIGNIGDLEKDVNEFPFDINTRGFGAFFKRLGNTVKGIFNRTVRIRNKEKKTIEREVTQLSRALFSLEPYVINIDISFNLNIEKLRFVKIESQERIRKLFYLYTHCIYSTLKSTVSAGSVEKHLPTSIKDEWSEFIKHLNIVQASLLNQLYLILPLFINNLEIRNTANLIIKQVNSSQSLTNMSNQKITIINGELCRVPNVTRAESSDISPLIPILSNRREIQEDNILNRTFLKVSILFWIVLVTWVIFGVVLSLSNSIIIGYCFHFLTLFISLLMSGFVQTLLAYMLLKNNYEESSRLKSYLSLNPVTLVTGFNFTSFVLMALTFILLGVPMLNINQVINYEALVPNWKKSLVAISGPIFHLVFGQMLSSIYLIGVFFIGDALIGELSKFLILGMRLQAFLLIINLIPLPPITNGYKAISPYLPESITRDISNAKDTLIFFVLSTLLFIFISQSTLVISIVDFIVNKVYFMDKAIN